MVTLGVDGGIVDYRPDEDDLADALNNDTFGSDAVASMGNDSDFFSLGTLPMKKPVPVASVAPTELNVMTRFSKNLKKLNNSNINEIPIFKVFVNEKVEVVPIPFTKHQKSQCLCGCMHSRWRQKPRAERTNRNGLMSTLDKEIVMKIQLNQMVAVSGSSVQNYKGKFIFSKSDPVPSSDGPNASCLGKRLYSSVFHPRQLLEVPTACGRLCDDGKRLSRWAAEECNDLLLDVNELDDYISSLHPLADDRISDSLKERENLLFEVLKYFKKCDNLNFKKKELIKNKLLNKLIYLLNPKISNSSNNEEAEYRKCLIFRRASQTIQKSYIQMLESIID